MKFLDLIFPIKCGICGKTGKYICENCKFEFNKNKINQCEKNIFWVYKYQNIIKYSLLIYKLKDHSYLYKTFSILLKEDEKVMDFVNKYDIIIPVPLNIKRYFERGYNQSELIIKDISKNIDIKILKKIKNIETQIKRNELDRKKNQIGAYKVINIEKIKNKKILIFDDIYTTGSTTKECKKVLLEAGAKEVGILTIAKTNFGK